MKKIIVFVLLITGFFSVKAQGVLDKVNSTLNKVDNASSTADKAGSTGSRVLGFFKKKKKTEAEISSDYQTAISIKGISMEKLKKLNENVKLCKGVSQTKMKYSNNGSTILVAHSNRTEELFAALEKSSKSIFTDKNVESMEDGKVSILLPKE